MIVVAETTPISSLIRIGYVGFLRELYERVLFPPAVIAELLDPKAPQAVIAWAQALPEWVTVAAPALLDASLPIRLGPGEREAISLALEQSANVVLMDETAGRNAARERNLQVTGTLGILLRLDLAGRVSFDVALRRLRDIGFWLTPATESKARQLLEEMRISGTR